MPQWKQYSGIWTSTQQAQAVGDNNWPGVVLDELYVWGLNTDGSLGTGNVAALSSPTQIGTDANWTGPFFATRRNASFSVKSDGLYATGANSSGSLGTNDNITRSSPVQIGTETGWTKIAQGETPTYGIRDGKLFSWGSNGGKLGLNDTTDRSSPTQVGALTTWTSCAGADNSAAAISAGKLYTWGSDDGYGLLGRNTNSSGNSSPIQVGALTDWAEVDGGKQFYSAVKTDGTLWGWGNNTNGQIGDGTVIHRSSPVQIGALTNWSEVSAGIDLVIAIKTDNTMWAWGNGSGGGTGLGSSASASSPVQIGALTDWVKARGGQNRGAAQRTSGVLYVWGSIFGGQAGDNNVTTGNIYSPVQVANGEVWNEWSFYAGFVASKRTTIT